MIFMHHHNHSSTVSYFSYFLLFTIVIVLPSCSTTQLRQVRREMFWKKDWRFVWMKQPSVFTTMLPGELILTNHSIFYCCKELSFLRTTSTLRYIAHNWRPKIFVAGKSMMSHFFIIIKSFLHNFWQLLDVPKQFICLIFSIHF